MPSWMKRLQSTVRNGRRTSTNSCSREVGRGSSSHDFGGDSWMIRRSSAEVTGVRVDRLKAVGGKTGGGEPSVSFRMFTSWFSGNLRCYETRQNTIQNTFRLPLEKQIPTDRGSGTFSHLPPYLPTDISPDRPNTRTFLPSPPFITHPA